MLYETLPAPDQRGGRNHLSLTVNDAAQAVATLKARPAFATYGPDSDGSRVELMEPSTVDGQPAPFSSAPPPVHID